MSSTTYYNSSTPCPVCGGKKDCRMIPHNVSGMPIVYCKKIKWDVAGFVYLKESSIGFGMHVTYADKERYDNDYQPHSKIGSLADAVLKEMRADPVQNAKVEREAARKEADVQKRLRERRPMDEFELDYFCQHLGGFSPNIAKLFDVQIFVNSTSRTDIRKAEPQGMYPWGTIVEYVSPEKDASGNVIGINRRFQPDHDYKSKITGEIETDKKAGRTRGLVIPDESHQFDDIPIVNPRILIICEGLTGAMAYRQMGFRVVGKPSNVGGSDLLAKFLPIEHARNPFDTIIIVGDNDLKTNGDFPGRNGAIATARALTVAGIHSLGTGVNIVYTFPPHGCKDGRDAWKKRESNSIAFGHGLLQYFWSHVTIVGRISDPSSISIGGGDAIGTDGASESGSALTATTSTSPAHASTVRYEPIEERYRSKFRPPISSQLPKIGLSFCPNPNRSLNENLITDQGGIWQHPCRRNDCPYCGERNRAQKYATVSHHISTFAREHPGEELHMFEVHPDDWDSVSLALRKKRSLKNEPQIVNYFCVGSETMPNYLVVATAKPSSRKIHNHQTVIPLNAMVQLLEIISSWENVKQEFWSSSKGPTGWKLVGNEKPKDNKWAGWTRVCGIRATPETIIRILNAHDIDCKFRTIAQPFWSWRMWIWDNTAASEKAVEDILNGELGTSDIDVDALFQTTIANFTHGASSPVAVIDTGPPPDWN